MHICPSCFSKYDPLSDAYGTEADSRGGKKGLAEDELQTRFYCCGRVPPEGPYRKRHGMCDYDSLKKESSVELAVEALENQNLACTRTINPTVPFVERVPEELYLGRTIEIQGQLSSNARRFSINLSTGTDKNADLAFHFNPRFDTHVVIRNHRIHNKWGLEEIASLQPFPFTLGRKFSVLIFVADEQFLIAVNKIHFCAFFFRIPVDRIKSLIVLGDVSLNMVEHNDRTHYPPQIFKKTPFVILPQRTKSSEPKCVIRRKIKSLTVGSKINICGRLKVLPQAFYVNLQKGIALWPHPLIPFHMNLRLHQPDTHKKEKEIIFNSWSNGFWGKEEIITFCPFLPGTAFDLKIIIKEDEYNVTVNDKFLFNYRHRVSTDIDAVVIHGDVVISKVVLL